MKTKLTLSVDKDLVQFARLEARAQKTSVSGMFADYLLRRKARASTSAVPTIADMSGVLKQYGVDDSKSAVRAAYARKYSR